MSPAHGYAARTFRFALAGLLVLGFIAATVALVSAWQQEQTDLRRAQVSLEAASAAQNVLAPQRQQTLQQVAAQLASDRANAAYLAAALGANGRAGGVDTVSIADLLTSRARQHGLDHLWLLTTEGMPVAGTSTLFPVQSDYAALAWAALDGGAVPGNGYWNHDGRLSDYAVVPLQQGDAVLAILLATVEVDESQLAERATAGAEQVAYLLGGPAAIPTAIAQTRQGFHREFLDATLARANGTAQGSGRIHRLLLGGQEWLGHEYAVPARGQPVSRWLLSRPTQSTSFLATLWRWPAPLLAIVGLLTVLAFLASLWQLLRSPLPATVASAPPVPAQNSLVRPVESALRRLGPDHGLLQARSAGTGAADASAGGDRSRLLGQRYEVVSVLYESGEGRLLRALDSAVGDLVLLRTWSAGAHGDDEHMRRAHSERLQRASTLQHPNILRIAAVQASDVDPDELIAVLAQEHGITLDGLLAGHGQLPTAQALVLLRQLGEALAAAHDARVTHGQLASDRVLVTLAGDLKLCWLSLRPAGHPLRRAIYQAPEQVDGNMATVRSDVFALAALTIELFTRRPPPRSAMPLHSALAARNLETVMRVANIPEALRPALIAALALDPQERPAGVRELLDPVLSR